MNILLKQTHRLVDLLGHDEMPLGMHYTNEKPDGYGPKPGEIFTREREAAGEINWQNAFGSNFTCIFGSIWLARKKNKAAWLSHESCGCMGGGFFSGIYGPSLETNIMYVSTGIPGTPFDGEHYMASPESMRAFMKDCEPVVTEKEYCVIKPLEQFTQEEPPLVVIFFARPEVLTGLHVLAGYASDGHNAVAVPFGAGCTNIIAWPLAYAKRGEDRAVLGGFDPSARKFMKTDEMTFAMPIAFYQKVLNAMESSALTRHTWEGCRKKVLKSQNVWGESVTE